MIHFQFLINKRLDYQGQEEALLAHANPFALMVATQLAAIASRSDPQARLARKTDLTRSLLQKGLDKKAVIALFRFIDGVLSLPEALENTYNDYVQDMQKAYKMAFITPPQKVGRREGFKEGMQQGQHDKALEIAAQMFKKGFKVSDVKECTGLDNEDLSAWISVH